VDTTTTQHQRNLIVNDGTEGWPDEAAVIRQAATDILDRRISLKAVARDLRDRGEPTVTGTAWSAKTLRDILLKAAVAGKQVRAGELVEAPWEPILDQPTWKRLGDHLTDPSRRTNTGRANEPRWLLSGFAVCGVCGGRTRVAGGKNRAPAYVGAECCHVRRNAKAVDALITDLIIGEDPAEVSPGRERVLGRLEEDDVKDLLRPEPRVHPDGTALRAERARLRKGRRSLMETFGLGDADAAATIRKWDKRLAEVEAQLAVSDQPDPLPEFRTGEPARAVWEGLPMPRRRAIVQVLLDSIVIRRAGRKGSAFDPETIKVRWNEEVRAEAPAR
jgi:site-specific DNA recombinase